MRGWRDVDERCIVGVRPGACQGQQRGSTRVVGFSSGGWWVVYSWCVLGVLLVYVWCVLDVLLVQSLCIIGVLLLYTWCLFGVFVVYAWCIIGVFLLYSWCTLDVLLVYSWREARAPPRETARPRGANLELAWS